MLNNLKNYNLPLIGFAILFITGNTYFGWNLEPQSKAEEIFDSWWSLLLIWGIIEAIAKKVTWNYTTIKK
jgi:hypothetical protein